MEKWKWIGSIIGGAAVMTIYVGLANTPGCVSAKEYDARPAIRAVAETNKSVAERLPERANIIDQSTDKIVRHVPQKQQAVIVPFVSASKSQTAGIRDDAVRLQETLAKLGEAKAASDRLYALAGRLEAKVAKLDAEKKSALRKLVGFAVVGSVIGLGVCAALFASGQRSGVFGGIGCGVTLVAAVCVGWYSAWLAMGAGVVLLAGLGWVVHRLRAEVRATDELVATNELAKQKLTKAARVNVFGDAAVRGQADLIQSASTKKLVEAARGKRPKARVRLAPTLKA